MKTSKPSSAHETNNQDLQLIITVVSLFLFFPLGLVFMFMWMKWPLWAKSTITILSLMPFIFMAGLVYLFLTLVLYRPASNNMGVIPQENTPQYSATP